LHNAAELPRMMRVQVFKVVTSDGRHGPCSDGTQLSWTMTIEVKHKYSCDRSATVLTKS
jgi:hypothetical protein